MRVTNEMLDTQLRVAKELTGLELCIECSNGSKKLNVKHPSGGWSKLNYKGFTSGEIYDQLETLINVLRWMETKGEEK